MSTHHDLCKSDKRQPSNIEIKQSLGTGADVCNDHLHIPLGLLPLTH